SADVYVWTSGGAWNRRAKCEIRDSVPLQKLQQRATLRAVRMKLDIHRVVVVQPPAIVNSALSKHRDRKLFLERVREEALHFPGVAEIPAARSGVTRESRGADEALLRETKIFRDLVVR